MIVPLSLTEKDQLKALLQQALLEDCPHGDITSDLFCIQGVATAQLVAKQNGIFYGQAVIDCLIADFFPTLTVVFFKYDGDPLKPQDSVCELSGSIVDILKIERIMLNIIQRLSGIATHTSRHVHALHNPTIAVMDTRKTTPLYRFLERKAVLAGGGVNHRFSLSDMVLLKENHLTQLAKTGQLSQLGARIKAAKQTHPSLVIEVEIEASDQLKELDLGMADIIMLDNFGMTDLQDALELCIKKYPLIKREISGNIALDNIATYRELSIHRISVGGLTHSAPAFDFSLLIR